MSTVRIRRRLSSPIAELPELDCMIGKDLEIVVSERSGADAGQVARRRAALDALDALAASAREEGGYDLNAVEELRKASMTNRWDTDHDPA